MNSMFLHEDEFEYICHRADKSNILSKLPTIWQLFQYETSDGTILHPINGSSESLSWFPHLNMVFSKARQMLSKCSVYLYTRNTDLMH